MIDRRQFLYTAAGTAVAAGIPASISYARGTAAQTPNSSAVIRGGLKAAAGPRGPLIGAFVDPWQLQDPKLLPLILDNFNLITLGKLKWGFVRPTPTTWNFTEPDIMTDFCTTHGIAMHGHNLCWNSANPAWLVQTLTKSNAAGLLTTYIRDVMKRYEGRITSWDVVNEPIASWMGRPDGLYTGPWLDALGPSYIDIAFHAAEQADPTALRVLNIAHVEQGGSGSDTARTLTLRLIEDLLKRRVPVQAIGFESHLAGTVSGASTTSRATFINELVQFGLDIILTEIDVDDTRIAGTLQQRDAAVADCYSTYLSSVLPQARPKRVVFFCFTDQKNWYDSLHTPRYLRGDGAPHRPGLLDAALTPKPAYASAYAALRGPIA